MARKKVHQRMSSSPTKIILLNGPPRCGKDTGAELIRQSMPSQCLVKKFATPLKIGLASFARMVGASPKELLDDAVKDTPLPSMFGATPRNFQIAMSENFYKPLFGPSIFGQLFIRDTEEMQGRVPYIVVSDSGFRVEAVPVVMHFNPKNVLLIRIHREGCDFTKDSRSYLDLADLSVTEVDINNNEDLVTYSVSLLSAIEDWERDAEQTGVDG